MAKAYTFGSTVNQARNIRHNKGLFIPQLTYIYHAQYRGNGGKMVLRNLRPCGRNLGHQTGLAYAWIAYQTYIRQELQLQLQVAALTRLTELRKCRGTVGTVGKFGIATATTATFGNNSLLAQLRQICQ